MAGEQRHAEARSGRARRQQYAAGAAHAHTYVCVQASSDVLRDGKRRPNRDGGRRDPEELLTVSPLACSGRVGVDRRGGGDGETATAG